MMAKLPPGRRAQGKGGVQQGSQAHAPRAGPLGLSRPACRQAAASAIGCARGTAVRLARPRLPPPPHIKGARHTPQPRGAPLACTAVARQASRGAPTTTGWLPRAPAGRPPRPQLGMQQQPLPAPVTGGAGPTPLKPNPTQHPGGGNPPLHLNNNSFFWMSRAGRRSPQVALARRLGQLEEAQLAQVHLQGGAAGRRVRDGGRACACA